MGTCAICKSNVIMADSRYADKVFDAMGDLVHAENHTALANPDIAQRIRSIRKGLEEDISGKDAHKHPGGA